MEPNLAEKINLLKKNKDCEEIQTHFVVSGKTGWEDKIVVLKKTTLQLYFNFYWKNQFR